MITRYGVWLDGLPLHELDPAIIVTNIIEQPAAVDVVSYPRARGAGTRVTNRTRRSLSVSVRFCIWDYDVIRRKAVMQKVIAWAKGGKYLSINDRPGQRLRVEVDELPVVQSSLHWQQEISLTFTAYANPYWEEETATVVNAINAAIFSADIPGDADIAMVDAVIQANNATITVKADKSTITLKDVSGVVEISHGDDGILRIMSNGESILSHRTPESSDDLTATPGKVNQFSVSGGTAVFSIRGVWA